jgi:hypothetical protein
MCVVQAANVIDKGKKQTDDTSKEEWNSVINGVIFNNNIGTVWGIVAAVA